MRIDGARSFAMFAALLFAPALAAEPRPLLVTVDDLPLAAGRLHTEPAERERITRELLAALARHRIRAIGFVVWDNVRTDADRAILDAWLRAGHELGNHSATHPDFTRSTIEDYVADVEKGRAGLAGFLAAKGGAGPRWFRFPMLSEGDTSQKLDAMRAYLEKSGQRNAHVTIDDQDWSFEGDWVEARRAGDRARLEEVRADYLAALRLMVRHHEDNGDRLFERTTPQVLLLHANEVGAANWDALFAWLAAGGHRFATADDVYSDPVFGTAHHYVGPQGFSLWDRISAERAAEKAAREVGELLLKQAGAWNRGDLAAFTSAYAEDAVFVTPSGITRGRDAVLARYQARYPTKDAMGTLSFVFEEVRASAGVEVSLLGDSAPGRPHTATVVARWTLTYPGKPAATGWTLIAFERRPPGGWFVTRDASM
jgi:peptidoglycan-N-acetylglucosamine deacetylase